MREKHIPKIEDDICFILLLLQCHRIRNQGFQKHTDCAMAQAEARVRSQASPYGIYSGLGGILWILWICPYQYRSTIVPHSYFTELPTTLHDLSIRQPRNNSEERRHHLHRGESLSDKLTASLHSHPQKRTNVPSDVPQYMNLLTFFSEDNPKDC